MKDSKGTYNYRRKQVSFKLSEDRSSVVQKLSCGHFRIETFPNGYDNTSYVSLYIQLQGEVYDCQECINIEVQKLLDV